MKIFTPKAQFAAEFIDIEKASGIDGAQWEAFQMQLLNTTSRFSIDVKSRQIAWSFTAALDAYCDALINPGWPHVFVSINLDEAKEKLRYVRNIMEATDDPVRPKKLKTDSVTEIEFADGSRFITHPCRPVRGKAGTRVYLDEMAHYQEGMDKTIYTAALPATTKAGGYIRIGSSPLGARGLFWEIATESIRQFKGFVRRSIPWWNIRAMCLDVKAAGMLAPYMTTEERVYKFGSIVLIELYENMFLEDFQQEYECAWVDEATSWISWETIAKNQNPNLLHWHCQSVDEVYSAIPEILKAISERKIENTFSAGIDIGRKRDLTECFVLGKNFSNETLPTRIMISLENVKYDDQQACFIKLFNELPIVNGLIDENGIGGQLAENLNEATHVTENASYTIANKELWAVEARIYSERHAVPIPTDRDLAYQIHSVKKKVTTGKTSIFDTERNEKHHADKFWAWATAIYAGSSQGTRAEYGSNPTQGYRG